MTQPLKKDEYQMAAAPSTLLDRLLDVLRPLGRVAVGYSGGVDSSVVVAAAARALGPQNVLAVTSGSATVPASELRQAAALAARLGVKQAVIETAELENEDFCANSTQRCYHCKTELWRCVAEAAAKRGISQIADGVNADDTGDFRPGIAAGDEAGVIHPLAAIGAGKAQVRALAGELGLPNSDKPAQACLSSRFPYGSRITREGLRRVEEAEEAVRGLGFLQVRVRDHGGIARIEVPADEVGRLADRSMRLELAARLKALGFDYVTLDLEGFRSGSLNETLIPRTSR